ncbi:MAG: hypothetical protein GXY38_01845, partial [Planctomycetes bacterium]|nr:hypothetical protein [Planctomycetota bacterium]
MNSRLWILAAMVACLHGAAIGQEYQWIEGRWVAAPPPVAGTPQGDLALIRANVHEGKYSQAVKAVEKFV